MNGICFARVAAAMCLVSVLAGCGGGGGGSTTAPPSLSPTAVEYRNTPGDAAPPAAAPNETVTLSGKLTAKMPGGNHSPAQGARVYAIPGPGQPGLASASAVADEHGQYELLLAPGLYVLYAVRGELVSEVVSANINANRTRNLVLEPDTVPPPPSF